MTRINVVPVAELCDQHLFAEFRELTRIPNSLVKGRLKVEYSDRPTEYTLGDGHVKFFTNKVGYLYLRYTELFDECRRRGIKANWIWPKESNNLPKEAWGNYTPTTKAMMVNRARIAENMPARPRFTV